jgi:hypothetical protein
MDAAEANAAARNTMRAWRQAKVREEPTAKAADAQWPGMGAVNTGVRRASGLPPDEAFNE